MGDVNLSGRRIRKLRESDMTVADLRLQIGLDPIKPSIGGLKTKAQISKLGRSVSKSVDRVTPRLKVAPPKVKRFRRRLRD